MTAIRKTIELCNELELQFIEASRQDPGSVVVGLDLNNRFCAAGMSAQRVRQLTAASVGQHRRSNCQKAAARRSTPGVSCAERHHGAERRPGIR